MRIAALLVAVAALVALAAGAPHKRLSDEVKTFEGLDLRPDALLRTARFRRVLHPGTFSVNIRAFNKDFTLDLERNTEHDLALHNGVEVHGPEGVTTPDTTGIAYYKGTVKGENSSFVHLRISQEGSAYGTFITSTDSYHIEPTEYRFDTPQGFNHVIYRSSDHYGSTASNIDSILTATPKLASEEGGEGDEKERTRRAAYVQGQDTCQLALVADSAFYANVGSNSVSHTMDVMVSRFTIARDLFENNANDVACCGIRLQIKKIIIYKTAGEDPYDGHGTNGQSYLENFSKTNWAEFCLAHVFTYYEFPNGLLGLAWLAYPDNTPGGICQGPTGPINDRSYTNTGFSTSLNFGHAVDNTLAGLVMAHELGHNFGSPHDAETVGSDSGAGRFLMWPYAMDGTKSNNLLFSTDSKASISAAVNAKGGCFVVFDPDLCGNGVQELSEECDCGGSASTCSSTDSCCVEYTDNGPNNCKLKGTSACSPHHLTNGACCQSDCTLQPNSIVCKAATQCTKSVTCNNGICDLSTYEEAANTACGKNGNDYSKLCNNGECSTSVCALWSLTECTSTGANACFVSCTQSATCKTTDQLGTVTSSAPKRTADGGGSYSPTGVKIKKAVGSACEFKAGLATSGYCDASNVCVDANGEDSVIDDLFDSALNLFSQENLKKIFEWAKRTDYYIPNWAWLLIGFVILVGICIVGCGCCRSKNKKVSAGRGGKNRVV